MLDAKMALAVGWLSDSRCSKSRQPIGQQCLSRSGLVGYADGHVRIARGGVQAKRRALWAVSFVADFNLAAQIKVSQNFLLRRGGHTPPQERSIFSDEHLSERGAE